MANALAKIDTVDIDAQGLHMVLYVAFSGAEVNSGTGAMEYVDVRLLADDSVVQVGSKVGAAIRSFAASKGWTIPAQGNVIAVGLQRV